MASILDRIVAQKWQEITQRKAQVALAALEQRIARMPPALNFSGALWGDEVRLIGEVKKASPSRGLLAPDLDPVRLALAYARNGAAAVSVLTDPHFQGTPGHLIAVKEALAPLGVPVLRKDFIIDPYQLYEARAWGADAVLLIVALLSPGQLRDMLRVARSMWLQCLVEVHTREELETALEAGAEVIGINNRDLRTFRTDPSATERLAQFIPRGKVVVSESGISTREQVLQMRRLGVHAVLVGETLVTSPDPGAKVRELLGAEAPSPETA